MWKEYVNIFPFYTAKTMTKYIFNHMIFPNMSFDKYTKGKWQQIKLKLGDYNVNS